MTPERWQQIEDFHNQWRVASRSLPFLEAAKQVGISEE